MIRHAEFILELISKMDFIVSKKNGGTAFLQYSCAFKAIFHHPHLSFSNSALRE